MIVVGITGQIAAGKSHVAAWLAERGAIVIDADRLAAEVTSRPEVVTHLCQEFGEEIVTSGGQLNRRGLARLVFGPDRRHDANLSRLEAIVHPPVRREIRGRLREAEQSGVSVAVLDVPLLIRSGWVAACDYVLAVVCNPAVQQRRIEARRWTIDDLRRREKRQAPLAFKCRLADRVIVTDDTETARRRVDEFWNGLAQSGGPACDRSVADDGDDRPPGCVVADWRTEVQTSFQPPPSTV